MILSDVLSVPIVIERCELLTRDARGYSAWFFLCAAHPSLIIQPAQGNHKSSHLLSGMPIEDMIGHLLHPRSTGLNLYPDMP